MGTIPLLLHSTLNLVSLASTLWPGFFLPLGITMIVLAIVGLFGELTFFQWIAVYYIEAFAGIAFSVLVCLIMAIVKLFIFGTTKIRIAEDLKINKEEDDEIRKAIEDIELEELDMGLIINFLKWSYTKIKIIRVDVYLFRGWNWLVIVWLVAMNVYATVDFFGFHFLTSLDDWIFGVVVLSVALLFFIVGGLLTWWILWMDHRVPFNSMFFRRKRKKKERSKSIRGDNVWTMEVIAYIMQIPIFKCSLVFSYWLFFRYYNYTERVSLLIGLGFFIVVDGLLIVLLKILKRWIGGRWMYSPEEMESKKNLVKEIELQKKKLIF